MTATKAEKRKGTHPSASPSMHLMEEEWLEKEGKVQSVWLPSPADPEI